MSRHAVCTMTSYSAPSPILTLSRLDATFPWWPSQSPHPTSYPAPSPSKTTPSPPLQSARLAKRRATHNLCYIFIYCTAQVPTGARLRRSVLGGPARPRGKRQHPSAGAGAGLALHTVGEPDRRPWAACSGQPGVRCAALRCPAARRGAVCGRMCGGRPAARCTLLWGPPFRPNCPCNLGSPWRPQQACFPTKSAPPACAPLLPLLRRCTRRCCAG